MSFFPASLHSLAERFAEIIHRMARQVMQREHRHPPDKPPVMTRTEAAMLIGRRLNGIRLRFAALLTRFRAGTLQPRRPPDPTRAARRARPHRPPRAPPDPASPRLPRRFGWLRELVPETECGEYGLTELAPDAEMQALIAAAPQATRRVIGPLYWMLGMHPPPELRPPLRPGAKERPPPMMRSVRLGMAAGKKVSDAYQREQARLAQAGIPPPPPPLPYALSTDPEFFTSAPTRPWRWNRVARG